MCNIIRPKHGSSPHAVKPRQQKALHIGFSLGKCEMQVLPMGLCNGPDTFQEKMSGSFAELECVKTHIDDPLITTNSDLADHLEKLDIVLAKLKRAGLKINANESFFCQEHLGSQQ